MSATTTASTRAFPRGAAERQGLRAGVVSRLAAAAIDLLYAVVLLVIAYAGYAGFRFLRDARSFTWPQPSFDEALGVGAIVVTVMLTTSWSSTGRTVGMRLLGLRLIGRTGGTIGPIRSLLRAVACLVFPLGLCWSAFSVRNASLQDLLFGTSVVYDWRMHVPAARIDDEQPAGDDGA
jgi:uncharacterized RDD family membrane protein YckC